MAARLPRSLRARIGLLLAAAALPAAAVWVISAVRVYDSTVEANNEQLADSASFVAQRVEDEISEAARIANLLASLPGALTASDSCPREFEVVAERFPAPGAVALVRPDRTIACAVGVSRSNEEVLLIASTEDAGNLSVAGGIAALSVGIEGRPDWRLAVAEPLNSPVEAAVDAVGRPIDIEVIHRDWTPVSSPARAINWRRADGDRPSLDAFQATTSILRGDGNAAYRVSVAPIADSSLFAIAYRKDMDLRAEEMSVLAGGIAAPLLMMVLTVLAAWVGMDRMVLQWVDYLCRVTAVYGGGRTSVRAVRLENAPAELAELGAAFDRMAIAVSERANAAEEQGRARDLLLRELHHRIKNNFQLIASLLSLQKREAGPEVAAALAAHERRVAAIAAAYRVSYAGGEVGPVGLAPLLYELREIIARHGDRPWTRIELRIPGQLPELDLDRAVPAALLVTKLADARIGHSPDSRATVILSAREADGIITIDIDGGDQDPSGTTLSARLRDAFVMQIGATLGEAPDGSRTTVSFAVKASEANV